MNDSDPYINTEGVVNKGQITIGGPSKNQLWVLPFLFPSHLRVGVGLPLIYVHVKRVCFYAVTFQLILNLFYLLTILICF